MTENVSAAEYQRFRLWAGIAAITLNTALGWGLYFGAVRLGALLGFMPFELQLVLVIECGLLVLLPFEVLTGHAAEAWSGRSLQPFSSWLVDWFHVAIRSLAMAWVGGIWFGHSHFMPWSLRIMWGWMFFLLILLFGLTMHFWGAKRWRIPRNPDIGYTDELQRELRSMQIPDAEIHWVREADTTSVNITPMSFRRLRLAVTSGFIDHFSPRELALLIVRENLFVTTNRRVVSLGICMGWLIAGQFLAWALPATTPLEAALGSMAVFTSWCVVSLFVWPALNRAWCIEADAAMLDFANVDEAADIIRKLQALNSTDLSVGPGKVSVFHPIPPLNDRLRALRRAHGRGGPGPIEGEMISEKPDSEQLL
jgi:hypothetical protein